MRHQVRLFLGALLLCTYSPVSSAQSSPGAASVSAADMLEANPNRPSSSNAAETLAPGVIQWEYGWSREWDGLGGLGSALGGELRYGLTNRVEVRWGGDTFVTQSDGVIRNNGFGDQYFASQIVLRRQSPSIPAVAVSYAIKVPSASEPKGLGSGRIDHTFVFLASKDIHEFTIDFNTVTQVVGRDAAPGFDKDAIFILTLSHAIKGPLGFIAEISGNTRLNEQTPAFATNLWALTYRVHRRFVIDCAFDVEVTHGAPQKRVLFGFTYAIANLRHGT